MNEFASKLSEWLSKIEGMLAEYAPQAMELALVLVRIDAAVYLISGGMTAALLYVAYRIADYCGSEMVAITKERGERYRRDEEVKYGFGLGFSILACIPLLIYTAITLFNPYYWIAVINPLWGLAYKAMKAAGIL